MFYDFNMNGFSEEGVDTLSVEKTDDRTIVRCSSTHLTSFAVLVNVAGVDVSSRQLISSIADRREGRREESVYFFYFFSCSSLTNPQLQVSGQALQIVSYIGLAISLIFLLAAILFFLTFG